MGTPTSKAIEADLQDHVEWLRRLAAHLLSGRDGADDLVQETLTAAVRHPPTRKLRPWLAEVMRNFVRRQARDERRRRKREHEVATLPSDDPAGTDQILERIEVQRILVELVTGLEEPFRQTVLLRYYDGHSAAEIARRLNIPAGTVRWRLKEGLERLRAELDRRHAGARSRLGLLLAPWAAGVQPTRPQTPGQPWMLLPRLGWSITGLIALGAVVVGVQQFRVSPAATVSSSSTKPLGADEPGRNVTPPGADRPPGVFAVAPETDPHGSIEGVVTTSKGVGALGAFVTAVRLTDQPPEPNERPYLDGWTRTTRGGRFRIGGLSRGRYHLVAAHPPYQPAHGEVLLDPGALPAPLRLRLTRAGAALTGQIRDSGGGFIAAAQILARIEPAGVALAFADDHGRYRITVARGLVRLWADADGYAATIRGIGVVGNEPVDVTLHPAARLSGRVLERETGKPTPGAVVRLVRRDLDRRRTATTLVDGEGRYAFDDIDPGHYQLGARAGSLVGFFPRDLDLGTAEVRGNVDLALEPAFTVRGETRDPEGRPIPRAQIHLRVAGQGESTLPDTITVSGADGRFEISGVLPGHYAVSAKTDGRAPAKSQVVVTKVDPGPVPLVLVPEATVTGRLIDATGAPVEGAVVTAMVRASRSGDSRFRSGAKSITAADGRFWLGSLASGHAQITAYHRERGHTKPAFIELDVGENDSVLLTLPPPASMAGRVTWSDGTPAEGARVIWRGAVDWRETATTTDTDGRYELDGLAPDKGVLRAERPNQYLHFPGGPAGPDRKYLSLLAEGPVPRTDLVLERPDKTIRGLVLDPAGKALAGALIRAERSDVSLALRGFLRRPFGYTATSGNDGTFTIDGLGSGSYAIVASHAGLGNVERYEVIAPGPKVRLQFAAPASAHGNVLGPDGSPISNFTVTLLLPITQQSGVFGGDAGVVKQDVRDENGAFTIEAIAPGPYDLVATTPDGLVGRIPQLVLQPGETRRGLHLRSGPGVTLAGRVLDFHSREGLGDIGISVSGRKPQPHTRTEMDGRFKVGGLVPGRAVTIKIRGANQHVTDIRTIPIPDEPGTVTTAPFWLLPREQPDRARAWPGIDPWPREGPLTVRRLAPGSAAERAGIQEGDVILSIDGRSTDRFGWGAGKYLLTGALGSAVELALRTRAGAPRTVRLIREDLPPLIP